MAKFNDLYEFIDRAVKNRKYAQNTAFGLKAALKLFEAEINEDEKNSIDKFEENLNQIYHTVSSKNKNVAASSLVSYKSRINRVLEHYKKYGVDPTKMSNWTVKPIAVRQKKQESSSDKPALSKDRELLEDLPASNSAGMHKIELALRPDKKFIIVVPMDITPAESTTIKAILDSLVVKSSAK
ncbi:MAG: hypothetical protein Q7K54_00885 [Candidatus Parcubacteria bacterium]|nr:hypothetical protein [Candidatus Parcubacteria bacterium]